VPKIKIAFFDIDWTLYDHFSHTWVASGLSSIKRLQTEGVKVFLCSARPYDSMRLFGSFNLGIKWDGYIASAGAVAYAEHHYVRSLIVPKKGIYHLIDVVRERGLTMELIGLRSRFLIAKKNGYVDSYHAIFNDVVCPVRSYRGTPITSALLFAPKEFDEGLMKSCPELLFQRFSEYGVDVMNAPHEKGDGIKDVLKAYGFKKDEAIAFGDDHQDLTMAPQVGIFVCVGNGKDEVKQKATFVSKPIIDGGIEEALRHFDLI